MNFVRFYEVNDWEGESWTFWLQLDGNEEAMIRLGALLEETDKEHDEDDIFSFYLDTLSIESEAIVDKLVEYADWGYMKSHNKVTGKFTCPDRLGENADRLYKGGIKDFFQDV